MSLAGMCKSRCGGVVVAVASGSTSHFLVSSFHLYPGSPSDSSSVASVMFSLNASASMSCWIRSCSSATASESAVSVVVATDALGKDSSGIVSVSLKFGSSAKSGWCRISSTSELLTTFCCSSFSHKSVISDTSVASGSRAMAERAPLPSMAGDWVALLLCLAEFEAGGGTDSFFGACVAVASSAGLPPLVPSTADSVASPSAPTPILNCNCCISDSQS
mmetsp:Transcript_38129/g.89379  ORF Transcript_38129/g.89379 Transcript_38129/m.89379 type:complete len:219 (+) Transcript_38129:850-1506(+)